MKIKIIFILLFSSIIFSSDNYFNLLKAELFSWGSNYIGQLGTGKNSTIDIPVKTIDASDVIKISTGKYHTLILKKDGTVWAFGRNIEGQLGDGTYIDKSYPVQVGYLVGYDENLNPILEPLSDIIDISAGDYHSLALKNDGTLFGWGFTAFYQAGHCIDEWKNPYNSRNYRPYGCEIHSISDIWKISAGSIVSIFLKKDGTVWGIGYDAYGQLQYDTLNGGAMTAYPVRISNLDNVICISTGEDHVMAIRNTGEVYCWGDNARGQIGIGKYSYIEKPKKVKNLLDVIDISAGMYFSVALKRDGTVWVWGDNEWGTLGDGMEEESYPLPKKVEGLPKIKNISASYSSVIAIDEEGNVWTWGRDVGYLLPNGSLKNENRPIKINELQNIIDGSNGNYHQIFLKNDGTVWGRMDNYYGQLGIGEFGYEPSPVPTKAPFNLVQIDGGYLYTLALKEDGSVWSWGYNYFGQLGTGKTKDEILYSLLPVQVQIEAVKQIGAGSEFGVALKEDGSVWTWGSNEYGQLGDGTGKNSNVPIKVMEGVRLIAAGNFHCLAIKEDESVWQWGWPHSRVPEKVSNLKNVIAVSGGKEHSIALKEDGTVWAWGWNREGQIGNGKSDDYSYYSIPQKVLNLENVVAISAGAYHNLAIKEDGTVWFWGWRQEKDKQYGWINDIFETVPVQIQNIPPISSASACNFFSLLVDFEGNLWTWGLNKDGQVGIGYSSNYPVEEPVKIIDTKDVISSGCGSFHSFAIKKINLDKFIIK